MDWIWSWPPQVPTKGELNPDWIVHSVKPSSQQMDKWPASRLADRSWPIQQQQSDIVARNRFKPLRPATLPWTHQNHWYVNVGNPKPNNRKNNIKKSSSLIPIKPVNLNSPIGPNSDELFSLCWLYVWQTLVCPLCMCVFVWLVIFAFNYLDIYYSFLWRKQPLGFPPPRLTRTVPHTY